MNKASKGFNWTFFAPGWNLLLPFHSFRGAISGLDIEGLVGKSPVLGVAQLVQARVNGILNHWWWAAH